MNDPAGLSHTAVAVLALLLASSATIIDLGEARADSPSDRELERFERHVESGARAMEREDYRRAIEELSAATEIIDHPRIRLHLGDAYAGLDNCERARESYSEVERRDDIDAEMRRRITESRAELGDCSSMGELTLRCEPEDLEVVLDGITLECSQQVGLEAGVYEGTASHEGYRPQSVRVRVESGERVEESIRLQE